MRKLLVLFLLFTLTVGPTYSQEELLELIEEGNSSQPVISTFNGSRLILGHSVEMRSKKELEFLISHRFGRINQGAHELFGLDNAWIRLGLEYGVSDRFNVGIGRSSFDKTIDSFLKYKLLQQTTGDGATPVSLVVLNSFTIKTSPKEEDAPGIEFSDRLANVFQLLIARKFSDRLSFQIMPTYVYKNTTLLIEEENQLALGAGGRLKLTPGLSFNAEYYYRVNPPDNGFTNSFSVGFDIETGGHVFQLHFTNSIMTVERAFVTETFDDFFDGDIHFGFNISRTFFLGSKKKDW